MKILLCGVTSFAALDANFNVFCEDSDSDYEHETVAS